MDKSYGLLVSGYESCKLDFRLSCPFELVFTSNFLRYVLEYVVLQSAFIVKYVVECK